MILAPYKYNKIVTKLKKEWIDVDIIKKEV